METVNLNGKYSFYTIDKSDLFGEEDISPNSDTNINTNVDINSENYDVYILNNNQIIEEYCSKNGSCNLYRAVDDNKFEVLYQKDSYNCEEFAHIYTKNRVYTILFGKEGIDKITYIDVQKYQYLAEHEFINENTKNNYAKRNMHALLDKGKIVCCDYEKHMLQEVKKIYTRYNLACTIIPCSLIVDEIRKMMTDFLEQKNIDRDALLGRYIYLQNFQEFCPNTIEILSPFIESPENADVHDILEKINKNLSNMDQLIDMYLSDEIEDVREENDKDDKER